jgi:ribosomal protein S18 acetylase RimI-like enzyme
VLAVIRALADDEVEAVGRVLGLARLHQGDGAYLVAWAGQDPMGSIHVTHREPPELQDLEVRDGYRRRGVASSLIAAAESDCAGRGATCVRVTVSVHNDAARALYDATGYADTGLPPLRVTGTIEVRSGPIEVDDTLLTLEKPLT